MTEKEKKPKAEEKPVEEAKNVNVKLETGQGAPTEIEKPAKEVMVVETDEKKEKTKKEPKAEEKPAKKSGPNLLHAALLLHSAGKEVNEANLKKVIDAAGVKADDAQVKALVSAIEDVDIDDAVSQAVAAPAAAAPAASGEASEKKKEAKDEAKEEKKAEEAVEGISSLFG